MINGMIFWRIPFPLAGSTGRHCAKEFSLLLPSPSASLTPLAGALGRPLALKFELLWFEFKFCQVLEMPPLKDMVASCWGCSSKSNQSRSSPGITLP